MQAGKLRDFAYFVQPVKNDWGERTDDYEVVAAFRVQVTDKSGDLAISNAIENITRIIEVTARYRNIPTGVMLAWENRFYLIKHPEKDSKKRWIKLVCEYKRQTYEYSIRKFIATEKATQRYRYVINKVLPEIASEH